jgi:uncharacterized protein with ParB-like and HNH nuclease domain
MLDQNDKIEEAEKALEENDDYNETPPADIIAFNELRSCADLVRMHKAKQLIITPDFQRDVVWSNPAQTRFIDSLVKQLPIPSMCLSLDYKTDKRLMIDGLQRISSIIKFLSEDEWRLSVLEDIDTKISGKTTSYIKDNHPEIYSRIENLTIPITVLRCDYSKNNHLNYLFTIFHRLNTGGNKLSNQEIRNCIYSGKLNNLLKELTDYENTRKLFDLEKGKSYRFVYEELFLRVLTFSESLDKYTGKLAKFLNDYMESKKKISDIELSEKLDKCKRTIDLVYLKIFEGKVFAKVSKTTIESILVGIYCNIDKLELESTETLNARLTKLKNDEKFSVANLSEGLAATDKVKGRISKGIECFS